MKDTMITLLDGKTYKREEILDKASDDKFYYGHLGKFAFSSTTIKQLLSSPKTYKFILEYGSKETQPLRDGWLFHTCVLEPNVFEEQIFVNCQSKNTKKFKDAAEKYGRVFTLKEKNDAERLADACLRNEMVLEKLNNSEFEQAEIGNIFGYPFRAKADVLTNNTEMYDLKSTSSLESWKYSADKFGYDIQAFLYCQLFDILPSKMGFIIIDKGSLDIGYAQVTDEFYERGMNKVKKALKTYDEWFTGDADLDQYYINIEL